MSLFNPSNPYLNLNPNLDWFPKCKNREPYTPDLIYHVPLSISLQGINSSSLFQETNKCYLFTRVIMYLPFSKSYMVLNWVLPDRNIYHAIKMHVIRMNATSSKMGDSSPKMVAIQSELLFSRYSSMVFVVLCKMKAPNAQSSGMLPTWFANTILLCWFKKNEKQFSIKVRKVIIFNVSRDTRMFLTFHH